VAVQYLESLDSVRSGRDAGVSDEERRLAELQAFLEVLMALALGREIVVPQSYAFDSGAFLRVAHRVLEARPKDSEDRPFRPHIFGTDLAGHEIMYFDDAVTAMLRRVHHPERPFHSSLYPALQEMTATDIERVLQDLDKRLVMVTGDAYAKPLKAVVEEFRVTTPLEVGPGTGLRLDASLTELVDPGSALSTQAAGLLGTQRDVYERLRSAVLKLDPRAYAAFGQRSRLRQDLPWSNDPEGRTAAEIVGEDLPLVVEFVDTIYNSVVVDSMGRPLALYSTTPTKDDAQVQARYLAQELALGRPPLLARDEQPTGGAYFEVAQEMTGTRDNERRAGDLTGLFEQGLEALGPLMTARSRPTSQFCRGVADMRDAVVAGNRAAYDKALEKHLEHVAKLLLGQVEIGFRGEMALYLMLKAGQHVVEVAEPTAIPEEVLETGLDVLGRGIKGTARSLKTRTVRRRLATALGSVVPPAFPEKRR
jgi:hypothetical protein